MHRFPALLLAVRILARDWRAGELNLLVAALVIAVSSVVSIGRIADRLQLALVQQSGTFLAADRVLEGSEPLPDDWWQASDIPGISRSRMVQFLTMVFTSEGGQLASVKAVDTAYPLRGRLQVAGRAFAEPYPTTGGPAPGEVWMASRLIAALGIQLPSRVEVGSGELTARLAIIREPDPGGGIERVAPRLLMQLDDVPATRVVQPGSRIRYRYLFAGEPEALEVLDAVHGEWLVDSDYSYSSARDQVEQLGEALGRAEDFLLLGSLLTVLLAGIAIAVTAHRYARRHFDQVAVLKSLGAGPARVNQLFALLLCFLYGIALVPGLLLGMLLEAATVEVLASLLPFQLPPASVGSLWVGPLTAAVALLTFGLPPLLSLSRISAMNVIRRDFSETKTSLWLQYGLGTLGLSLLLLLLSQDILLTLLLVAGLAAALCLATGLCYCLLAGGRFISAGNAWNLAWSGIRRRAVQNSFQVAAIAISIMLILTLLLVRTSLVTEWRTQLPDRAPNHFLINIATHEVPGILARFAGHGIISQPIYPMIRGRLAEVNGLSVDQHLKAHKNPGIPAPDADSSRNLTWTSDLPAENQVIAGRFWSEPRSAEPEVSVEADWAGRNGIVLGDFLSFSIQEQPVGARVTSIRQVDWGGLQPNFYLIFSPGVLEGFSSTHVTSFYLPPEDKGFLVELLRTWPTITLVEVEAVIRQIQQLVGQVTLAVELMLVLVLFAGCLVMLASVQASLDERRREQALLRALGAPASLILGSLAVEFCVLGGLAGLMASAGAEFLTWGLQTQMLRLDYQPHLLLWPVATLGSMLLLGGMGLLATRHLVRVPVDRLLRETDC